jgi:prolyl-tRNA synthetase
VLSYAEPIYQRVEGKRYSVKLDDRDNFKPGWKFASMKPRVLRSELPSGPSDVENKILNWPVGIPLKKEIVSRDRYY